MTDKYHDIIAAEKDALKSRLAQIKRRHNRELFVLFAVYAVIMLLLLWYLLPL